MYLKMPQLALVNRLGGDTANQLIEFINEYVTKKQSSEGSDEPVFIKVPDELYHTMGEDCVNAVVFVIDDALSSYNKIAGEVGAMYRNTLKSEIEFARKELKSIFTLVFILFTSVQMMLAIWLFMLVEAAVI